MNCPSEIVRRARNGDTDAYAFLMSECFADIYCLVRPKVACDLDADDVVQSTFVRGFEKIHTLRDDAAFAGWLVRIATNEVRNWHRRRLRQASFDDELAQAIQDPPALVDTAWIRALVHASIRELPDTLRVAVVLHYLRGETYVSVAERLGVGVEAVRSRLRRARTLLRREMETMLDQSIIVQEYLLDREDLETLRVASSLTGAATSRLPLQGIMFGEAGKIVSANAHGLLVKSIKGAESTKTPLVIGPWQDIEIPDADSAALLISDEGAKLRMPEGKSIVLQVIDEPYVDYERVIQSQGDELGVLLDGGAFEAALESINAHMEDRHPVDKEWSYRPMVELVVSPIDDLVTVATRRDMGYYKKEEGEHVHLWPNCPAPSPSPDSFDWEVKVSVPCETKNAEYVAPRKTYLDYSYFKRLVSGLVGEGDPIYLSFDEGKAVRINSAEDRDWLGLLMPLRMAS